MVLRRNIYHETTIAFHYHLFKDNFYIVAFAEMIGGTKVFIEDIVHEQDHSPKRFTEFLKDVFDLCGSPNVLYVPYSLRTSEIFLEFLLEHRVEPKDPPPGIQEAIDNYIKRRLSRGDNWKEAFINYIRKIYTHIENGRSTHPSYVSYLLNLMHQTAIGLDPTLRSELNKGGLKKWQKKQQKKKPIQKKESGRSKDFWTALKEKLPGLRMLKATSGKLAQ